MGVVTWRHLLVASIAVTGFFGWDLFFRTRINYVVLTSDQADVSILSHYKPGFTMHLQLRSGTRRDGADGVGSRFAHGAVFSFKNPILGGYYAKQCSSSALVLQVRPAPYLLDMGVRLAFLFGGWIGADFTTADQQHDGAASSSSLLFGFAPVARVDLLRFRRDNGSSVFASYMQESMALYGASNAQLVVSGDRVKVLRAPADMAVASEWDALTLFCWDTGVALQRMLRADAYRLAQRHWQSAVADSYSWIFARNS